MENPSIGGSVSGRTNTPTHDIYDPRTNSWAKGAPLPVLRDHLTVEAIDGKIVAAGGRVDGSPGEPLDANEIYDPKTDRWSEAKPMPFKRSGSAHAVIGDTLYVFGGEGLMQAFDDVEAFNVATNSWLILKSMPTGRHGFGAIAFDGKIFTLVGSPHPGGDRSDVVEVFSP